MNYNSPAQIATEFNKSAVQKASYPTSKLIVYSIMGGAFVAIGGLLSMIVVGGMPAVTAANPGLTKFVSGALFPLGLILVVIAGAELFTSDCAILPFGSFNKLVTWKKLAKIWTVVYLCNFIGALVVAYLFAYKTEIMLAEPWLSYAKKIGEYKTSHSFISTFIKGIGANWLVCMAVWAAYAAKDVSGKMLAVWVPVMGFVTLGFEHSIANMYYIPLSMFLGADVSIYEMIINNLIPATLGNIVGGCVFVALAYWFMFGKQTSTSNNVSSMPVSHQQKQQEIQHLN